MAKAYFLLSFFLLLLSPSAVTSSTSPTLWGGNLNALGEAINNLSFIFLRDPRTGMKFKNTNISLNEDRVYKIVWSGELAPGAALNVTDLGGLSSRKPNLPGLSFGYERPNKEIKGILVRRGQSARDELGGATIFQNSKNLGSLDDRKFSDFFGSEMPKGASPHLDVPFFFENNGLNGALSPRANCFAAHSALGFLSDNGLNVRDPRHSFNVEVYSSLGSLSSLILTGRYSEVADVLQNFRALSQENNLIFQVSRIMSGLNPDSTLLSENGDCEASMAFWKFVSVEKGKGLGEIFGVAEINRYFLSLREPVRHDIMPHYFQRLREEGYLEQLAFSSDIMKRYEIANSSKGQMYTAPYLNDLSILNLLTGTKKSAAISLFESLSKHAPLSQRMIGDALIFVSEFPFSEASKKIAVDILDSLEASGATNELLSTCKALMEIRSDDVFYMDLFERCFSSYVDLCSDSELLSSFSVPNFRLALEKSGQESLLNVSARLLEIRNGIMTDASSVQGPEMGKGGTQSLPASEMGNLGNQLFGVQDFSELISEAQSLSDNSKIVADQADQILLAK